MRLCAFADEASGKLDGQIAALNRNGIGLLEIRGVDGKSVAGLSVDEAKNIKKKLADAGCRVWSIGSPIGKIKVTDDFKPHFETYKRLIETAHILGADRMRIFSFYKDENMSPENTKNEAYSRLEKLIEASEDMVLCLENEKDLYGEDPVHSVELLKAFPQLKAVYDPANYIQIGADSIEAWNAVKPYVDYIHIKDCKANGAVVPPGKGIGRLNEIIADYLKNGGDVITVEPHLFEFTGLEELENGSTQSQVGALEFKSSDIAFDFAVNAVKDIIKKI